MTNTKDNKQITKEDIIKQVENGKFKRVRDEIYAYISAGLFTKGEIIELVGKSWTNVKAITVSTYLTDSKNVKYSGSEFLAVEDPKTKIFSFGSEKNTRLLVK